MRITKIICRSLSHRLNIRIIKSILKDKMVTTIEVIGLVIGIVSLLIAIYSIIQQRKLETKFREKERLKILAKRLDKVIDRMSQFSEIEEPTYDEHAQLQMLSQSIISEAFDTKKDIISLSIKTQIGIDEVTKTSEGEEKKRTNFIYAEKKEDVIKYLEEGKLTSVDIETDLGETAENEILSYSISYFLFGIPEFFYKLEKLENEFGDLVEEFSPNLLNSLKDCIKDLLGVAVYSKEIEVDTKAFSKTDDIGLWIYNTIMRREEISIYLNKLVELKVKFEKLRERLIMTSYT